MFPKRPARAPAARELELARFGLFRHLRQQQRLRRQRKAISDLLAPFFGQSDELNAGSSFKIARPSDVARYLE
jgi:hypothetical protein